MIEESNNITINPIETHLYKEREDFCIVALTGVLGSGFDDLTKIMKDKTSLLESVRKPEDIKVPFCNFHESERNNNEALSKLLFHRKYTICYNYIKENYAEYKVLKYNKVLWFYTLRYTVQQIANEQNGNEEQNAGDILFGKVKSLLNEKYAAYNFEGRIVDDNTTYNQYKYENINPSSVLLGDLNINWGELYDEIKALPNFTEESISGEDNKSVAEAFFITESLFTKFYDAIRKAMFEYDFYLYCMFYWRLGICIRATKNPFASLGSNKAEEIEVTKKNEGLFRVVQLISTIIKGYHKSDVLGYGKGSRICIDSLRNSFEARYLQERFSAFYLVNVYNKDVRSQLTQLIQENNSGQSQKRQKLILEALYQLYKKEATSEVDNGHLAMHDVDTCVSNAEIHITNRVGNEEETQKYGDTHFYSIAEQWMKFAALIQRPGLFNPDTEERCMQIAYTAKFNSGCISRQVGAVITNKDGSIRTIGWNDPPQGQVPCGLRDVADLLQIKTDHFTPAPQEQVSMMYSEFETKGAYDEKGKKIEEDEEYKLYAGKWFADKLPRQELEKFKQQNESLHLPYCFKQCHTTWHAKDFGNQFHQRAIHAEENAMMQMVKYGGEALKGGVIYVTASPCEICSKKLYQIGVKKIIYIDPYPGIAPWQVIRSGLLRPELKCYEGVYGASYFKLYSHFIDYKNELKIRGVEFTSKVKSDNEKERFVKYLINGEHRELLRKMIQGEKYQCEVEYDNKKYKAVAEIIDDHICFTIPNLTITRDVVTLNGIVYDKDAMNKYWLLYINDIRK